MNKDAETVNVRINKAAMAAKATEASELAKAAEVPEPAEKAPEAEASERVESTVAAGSYFESVSQIHTALAGGMQTVTNPLILAYIGDAVYEVYIRTMLVKSLNVSVHKLHLSSTGFVKAKAQSDIVHRIADSLTQEERDVIRRGRNAKSGTIPKNADVAEYKYATGLESLIGYIYLKGDIPRLMQVLEMCVRQTGGINNE